MHRGIRTVAWISFAALTGVVVLTSVVLWVWSARHPFTLFRDSDSGDMKHDYESHIRVHLEDGVLVCIFSSQTLRIRQSEVAARVADAPPHVSAQASWNDRQGWVWPMDHHFTSFGYSYLHERGAFEDVPYDDSADFEPSQPPLDWRRLDFAFPLWSIFLVAAIVPAFALRNRVVRRRRLGLSSICTTCGYDLRATPDRCPECGSKPTKKGDCAKQARGR
jgi:hypothetical protein